MWRSPLEAMPKDDAAYSDQQQGGYINPSAREQGYTLDEVLASMPSGASLASRDVVLQVGADSTGTVSLGRRYDIQSVLATVAGRLRLYRTAAERAADAARPITTDPENQTGCLAEGALPAGVAITNPTIPGTSGPDGLVYLAWEGQASTITLRVLTLEA